VALGLHERLRNRNQGIDGRDQQQGDENAHEKKVHVRRTALVPESIRAARRSDN
jgi:hypothetical protein